MKNEQFCTQICKVKGEEIKDKKKKEDKDEKKTLIEKNDKEEGQEYKYYHISDAVVEPDDKGEKDEEERNCVLMRHCKAGKPEN